VVLDVGAARVEVGAAVVGGVGIAVGFAAAGAGVAVATIVLIARSSRS
jgi:hypothetical protein